MYNSNMEFEKYFKNWPEEYYAITDGYKKEKVLKKHIELYHLKEDEERLNVFYMRYKKSHGKYIDMFTHSILNLQIIADTNINFLNKKKLVNNMINNLSYLRVYENITPILMEEWEYFLKEYISLTFKSYARPAFLGMGERDRDTIELKVNEHIEKLLKITPQNLGLEDDCACLYNICIKILNTYKQEN